MAWLFGQDFQDRIHLQRRQVYHQQLLDAQSLGSMAEGGIHPAEDYGAWSEGTRAEGKQDISVLGKLGLLLALLCFIYTIPALLLSAVIAAPASLGLYLISSALHRQWAGDYGEFYRAAVVGIFVYLTVTMIVGLAFVLLQASGSLNGVPQFLVGNVAEVAASTFRGVLAIATGEFSVAQLSGAATGVESSLARYAALAALHGPGLLFCARIFRRVIT